MLHELADLGLVGLR
ncbi:MAG: hypothetical protein ACJ75L_08755 [Gaiellaceae bacterium]